MRVSDGLSVLLSTMPVPVGVVVELSTPVVFRICPPVQPLVSAFVQVPPVPATTRLPVDPVPLSTMPFGAPFDEIEAKLRLPAVIPAVLTLRPVPMPVVIELPV